MIYKDKNEYDIYAVKKASKILDVPPESSNNTYSVNVNFPSAS